MAERKHHWIKTAIRHKGALRKELGVPAGKTIPEAKLDKAANSDNPTLRKRAVLAKTLKAMHHGAPHHEGGPVLDKHRAARLYGSKHVRRA